MFVGVKVVVSGGTAGAIAISDVGIYWTELKSIYWRFKIDRHYSFDSRIILQDVFLFRPNSGFVPKSQSPNESGIGAVK